MSYTISEVRDFLLPLAISCGYTDVSVTADVSKRGTLYWAEAYTPSGTVVMLANGHKMNTTTSLLDAAWGALYGKPINADSL